MKLYKFCHECLITTFPQMCSSNTQKVFILAEISLSKRLTPCNCYCIGTKTWLNCAETDEPKFDIEFVGCWKITARRNSWLWKQNCECVIVALNFVASWPHSLLCADATGSPSRCCAGVTRRILLEKTPWQTPVSLGSRSSHPRLQLIWSVIYQSGDCGAKKDLLGGVDSESASESSV